jgi:hypothetical protein
MIKAKLRRMATEARLFAVVLDNGDVLFAGIISKEEGIALLQRAQKERKLYLNIKI